MWNSVLMQAPWAPLLTCRNSLKSFIYESTNKCWRRKIEGEAILLKLIINNSQCQEKGTLDRWKRLIERKSNNKKIFVLVRITFKNEWKWSEWDVETRKFYYDSKINYFTEKSIAIVKVTIIFDNARRESRYSGELTEWYYHDETIPLLSLVLAIENHSKYFLAKIHVNKNFTLFKMNTFGAILSVWNHLILILKVLYQFEIPEGFQMGYIFLFHFIPIRELFQIASSTQWYQLVMLRISLCFKGNT